MAATIDRERGWAAVVKAGGHSERSRGRAVSFRRVFRTALVVVPLGLLGNIVYALLATDPEAVAAATEFPPGYLLLAVALALVPWITNTLRLLVWTRMLELRFRVMDAFRATLATEMGAAVSPTAVGGELFRWGVLVRRGVPPGTAASIVTLPSFEDGLFFLVAIPAALVFTASWRHPLLLEAAGALQERAGLVVTGLLVFVLVGWGLGRAILRGRIGRRPRRSALRLVARLRRKLRRWWREARIVFRLIVRRGKARFALNVGLSAVQWAARYSVVTALIAFLGAPVEPVLFWLFQWIVFTLMTFMPTPGATGGAEAAFTLLYAGLLPTGIIGLATAGWRFLTFYLQVGLAAILLLLLGPGPAGSPEHAAREPAEREAPDRGGDRYEGRC